MITKIKKLFMNYASVPVEAKASLWYTICSIVQKCISFITLPIFTRLLTEAQYGQYSIYQSWMSIIIIFCTLNLQYGSFDRAMIKYEDDRDTYISSLQGLVTVLTLCVFIIYLLAPSFWNQLLSLPTILVISLLVEIVFSTVIAFWNNKQKFIYNYKPMIMVTLTISFLSPLLGLIGVLTFEERGIARVLSNALIYLCIGLIIYIYHLYKGKKFYSKEYWKYALKFNIPLIPYYLSQTVFNQSDRIMIEKMCGIEKAGIYSLAYSVSIVLVFIINSINGSFVPWLYRKLKSEEYSSIKKMSKILVILIASILSVLVLFGPEAILILGGQKYYEAIWIIPPVTSSLLFLFFSQLSINVMFYFEENTSLVKGSILSAIINIVLNYFCINLFGYIAAGYTTLVSYILFWLCNLYYMNKVCVKEIKRYAKDDIVEFKYLLKISLVFVLFSIIVSLSYTNLIMRIGFMIVLVVIIWIKKDFILDSLTILKK